jgi:hypothetical protein
MKFSDHGCSSLLVTGADLKKMAEIFEVSMTKVARPWIFDDVT